VARDWNTEPVDELERRLRDIAPNNTAPYPLEIVLDSRGIWTVDIHVRIPRITEYELTGVGETLLQALERAHWGLDRETENRKHADAANRKFGVEV